MIKKLLFLCMYFMGALGNCQNYNKILKGFSGLYGFNIDHCNQVGDYCDFKYVIDKSMVNLDNLNLDIDYETKHYIEEQLEKYNTLYVGNFISIVCPKTCKSCLGNLRG